MDSLSSEAPILCANDAEEAEIPEEEDGVGSEKPLRSGHGDAEAEEEEEEEEEQVCPIVEQYQRALQDLHTFTLHRLSKTQLNLVKNTGLQKLYEKLQLNMESPAFLEKLESMHETDLMNTPPAVTTEDHGSWDVITESDLLTSEPRDARNCLDHESYILINEEDILDGMACFMARYLSSIPQAKNMTPKQLQKVIRKAFGISKKGRLRKWWDGSKAFYAAASWGATAVSLYNNPAFVSAASAAFWTSCRIITKFM